LKRFNAKAQRRKEKRKGKRFDAEAQGTQRNAEKKKGFMGTG
jgi:hypothetical protein